MAYDPRAFPTISPKKAAPPAPAPGTPSKSGDSGIRHRKKGVIARTRKRRMVMAITAAAVGVVAIGALIFAATRPPETVPYVPHQLTKTDLEDWTRAMGVLSRTRGETGFPGMAGGPQVFARQESERPQFVLEICDTAVVDPARFLATCDAIGSAIHVEEQDRRSEELANTVQPEAPIPDDLDLPEALRNEVAFGKKGAKLTPPKLSDHLPHLDKENYKFFQANREQIMKVLETVK